MLFAVARFDAPNAFAAIDDRNELRAGGVDFGQRGALGIGLVHQRAIFVRKILFAAVEFEFAIGAERGHLFRADGQFDHAGVEILDEHAVVFVILRLQAKGVGFDAQVDVFGDEDGLGSWAALS